MKVEQFEATSKDGTQDPVLPGHAEGFKADGSAPTLLYGYGGFEVSEVPRYDGVNGSAWLERGGVYVAREHPRRRRVRPGVASRPRRRSSTTGTSRTSRPSPTT